MTDSNLKLKFEFTAEEAIKAGYKFKIPPPETSICPGCGVKIQPVGFKAPFEPAIWLWKEGSETFCTCPAGIAIEQGFKNNQRDDYKKEQEKTAGESRMKKIESLFSQIPERFKIRTFKNFQITPENEMALKSSRKYSTFFLNYKKEGRGLLLTGSVGTGKTHLACAIANELLDKGIPVLFSTSANLLGKIKESFNNVNISEGSILKTYCEADLLIIDDLGKEKPSEWVIEKLFVIINERYESMKPIIVTTNFVEPDLIQRLTVGFNDSTARAIVSRLYESCFGVALEGRDWRTCREL